MKASIKFRDDQKPLFRAKVPLNILGFPFQSGIEAGDSKELCLNLGTFFESGPSLKLDYSPNNPWNPFSLVVKTGVGHFGSPISSPMTISAEFDLLGRRNPTFLLHFQPLIGDFSIKSSAGSRIALPSHSIAGFAPKTKSQAADADSDIERTLEGFETPLDNGKWNHVVSTGTTTCNAIKSLLTRVDGRARTVLPVTNHAKLNFRWGVRFPEEINIPFFGDRINNPAAGISLRRIPSLVLSKIKIEHVSERGSKDMTKRGPASQFPGSADVAETCFAVKRQLENLRAENGLLRKSMEEFWSEIASGRYSPSVGIQDPGKQNESEGTGGRLSVVRNRNPERKTSEFCGSAGKPTDVSVTEEVKKKLNEATC